MRSGFCGDAGVTIRGETGNKGNPSSSNIAPAVQIFNVDKEISVVCMKRRIAHDSPPMKTSWAAGNGPCMPRKLRCIFVAY